MIPSPWVFALLALASFRVWKLIADDSLLDRPRAQVLKRLDGKWELFLTCPWCAGFWISLGAYAGWIALGPGRWATGELWLGAATVLAISAATGLIASTYETLAA